jgi:hypothetical protein
MTINLGAINTEKNTYESAYYASKESTYICPSCKKGVFLRKGKVLRPHFAHYKSENPCTFYDHPGESEIHRHAKELIRHAHQSGKEISIETSCNTCKEKEVLSLPLIDIHLEYRFEYDGLKIADIAFVENDEAQCIIEICHKHPTCEGDRPEPWCEVNAEATIKTIESTGNIVLPCIRQKRCELCEERYVKDHFKYLDSKPNGWFLNNLEELKWYVRYMLGQRDFRKIPYNEHIKLKRISGSKRSHLTFDFDARSSHDKDNQQILNIFKRFYKYYKPFIYSHKGIIMYSIVRSNITEYDEDSEVDMNGAGTVNILYDIIIDIIDKDTTLFGLWGSRPPKNLHSN